MAHPERESLVDAAVDLLAEARAGRPGAWERLVQRFAPLVWSIPRERGLNEADCEDVFQETWVALHAHLHLIRRPRALPAWIAATAQHHVARVLRRRRHRPEVEAGELAHEPPDEQPNPEELALELEQRDTVHAALATISERCQRLLTLAFLSEERASYEELADALGIAPGSVGPIRHRCMAELLAALERRGL